jgi:Family of unknown function (DUF6788)
MPDSLLALEAQRSQILRQISTLGDLRPGSIGAVARRCGKPTCHCAKPNDHGHEPQLRLTRTVKGKTVAESFASPAAFQKAQAEVREYQRLQKLCADLVDVNERICRLRPVQKNAEKWSTEEKRRLLRSIKKSRANETPCCRASSPNGARPATWTGRPWSWRFAPRSTPPAQRV